MYNVHFIVWFLSSLIDAYQLASKREAIEWERNYMKTQLGHHEAAVDDLARVACKDKLLQWMHHEQSSLMAKIDQFQSRKDVEKQKILDDCIAKCKYCQTY